MRSIFLFAGLVAALGCAATTTTEGGGGSGGDGGSGAGASCETYNPPTDPPTNTVPITIFNNGATPIYLGHTEASCSISPVYRAETTSGEAVQVYLDRCEFSCGMIAQGACACPADCAQPFVTMIYPGGSFEIDWRVALYEQVAMPASCYEDQDCYQPTCPLPVDPTQDLVFIVDAYSDVADCSEAICDCVPGATGSCTVEGATLVAGPTNSAVATWANGASSIVVTFE